MNFGRESDFVKGILIAAKSQAICDGIAELVTGLECSVVTLTDGCSMRSIDVGRFGTIIVSTPLSDEFGLDLVAELYGKTDASLIVLAKGEIADEVQRRLKFSDAFVLPRPISRSGLLQAIRFAGIAKESIKRREDENKELTQQIGDLKLVGRAKACLTEYLGMTEEAAHRHIQKQAMDLRKTQAEIAADILKMYTNH